ncbi:MAG: chemotaxis protein CheA [Polyangiaceae bacterium]
MSDTLERARAEFLSEAEEVIETLGRDLLLFDESMRGGMVDPDVVNDIFRGVHTLKGLSSLFGATKLARLSHELETMLDALRLGKIEVDRETVDHLYRAVEVYQQLLIAEKEGRDDGSTALEELLGALRGGKRADTRHPELEQFDIDPSIFAVLTEYEEHRLRVNVQGGVPIFRLRLSFQLATIDESLDQLKTAAKPHGEIITYLPTGAGADADSIELDILLASKSPASDLHALFSPMGAVVTEIARRAPETDHPSDRKTRPPIALPGVPDEPIAISAASNDPSSRPPPDDRGSAFPSQDRLSIVPDPKGPDRGMTSVRSVTQTVRVDIQKLDLLMNIVGELGIVRSALDRLTDRIRGATRDRALIGDLVRLNRSFDRQLEAIQQGILEVRMVPLGQVFERLSRVARQIGRDLDKQFNLIITGSETEVDKLIVEELSDPLMHMMRNAIDHGIESQAHRAASGKPPGATIALNAFQKGSHVVIEIEDDGGGIDTELLISIALKRGLISPEDVRSTSRKEILGLIFLPGMTTKNVVSEHSGRGVGMDVVKTNISKLGGVIDVQSDVGIGTKFTITLPITLAIIRALIVEVHDRTFAIPLANVREAVALVDGQTFRVDDQEVMTLRGSTLRVCRLATFFEITTAPPPKKQFVVVTTAGNTRIGLVVDRLVGGQDVVIKALGPSLRSVRGFAGAAELGDQRLGLVLDTPAIVEELSMEGRGKPAQQRRSLG